MKVYYVYILHCDNNTYYTGYTTDLIRRYQEHVKGSLKCKYTRSFKPLRIAQSWCVKGCKSDAMKVERKIKKLCKKQKEQLILFPDRLIQLFQLAGDDVVISME